MGGWKNKSDNDMVLVEMFVWMTILGQSLQTKTTNNYHESVQEVIVEPLLLE